MPGLLSDGEMQRIKSAPKDQFDALFIQLMSIHHAGAVKMADQAWHGRGDPRLRVMALPLAVLPALRQWRGLLSRLPSRLRNLIELAPTVTIAANATDRSAIRFMLEPPPMRCTSHTGK